VLERADWSALAAMLRYRRPHNSKTERKFINRFLRPLGVIEDDFGNLMLEIGDNPRVMFCAHTDTVHRSGGKQECSAAEGSGLVRLHPDERISNCLGADNTAGVWLLMELIKAGTPGLYVFHRGEECGGLGSRWIAEHTPGVLAGIEIAIAFDRRGTTSVITHQFGGRTCSDAFANSFIAASCMPLRKDDGGTFTDTASYSDLISECTNISVGFDHEHSPRETLDVCHLAKLLASLLSLDWSSLVAARDPREPDEEDRFNYFTGVGDRWGTHSGWLDDDAYDFPATSERKRQGPSLLSLVESYPALVADILEQYGYDSETLADELSSYGAGGKGL